MLLFLLLSLAASALALPSMFNGASYDENLSGLHEKRAAPPKSARLAVSKMDGQPYWTTSLIVNGRPMTMMVDTGSADFWLHGPKAPPAKGGPGAKLVPTEFFDIEYGDNANHQTGVGVSTTVDIGALSVQDFTVGVVTHDAYKSPLDGIMGLGFRGQNSFRPKQQPTLMEGAQPYLQQPVFTLALKPDSQGALELGIVDHSKHQGTLVEAKVNNISDSSWTVDSVTLSSGKKAKVTQQMLFDTGGGDTMWADPKFVADYWIQVPGSTKYGDSTWIFPCKEQPPDMEISIGGSGSATIPGGNFKGAPIGSGGCIGLLQDGSTGGQRGTMGGPFFYPCL